MEPPGPLARFLPLIQKGAAKTWLEKTAAPGSWILDPFGVSPQLIVEIIQAGYKVLVTANNPVTRFIIEIMANPPPPGSFRAALAEMAAAGKGSERLEPHLRSLYQTTCDQCGSQVDAEAFIWERGAQVPSARSYRCRACNHTGEHPPTPEDLHRIEQFSSGGLHHARVLERVAPLDDPDRAHAEEALHMYTPRAVYALTTLINKLESFSEDKRQPMTGLLLSALDQTNVLWTHPLSRSRPKQLGIPTHFREHNVWLALEEAVETWENSPAGAANVEPLLVSDYSEEQACIGNLCIFDGRLKDFVAGLSKDKADQLNFQAVLCALPRPNPAYWSLSALWAGWLWGREAAQPFKSVLRRRRYDWGWHTTALQAAFQYLVQILPASKNVLVFLSEAESGFVAAGLIGAKLAGLELSGLAYRSDQSQMQLCWRVEDRKKTEVKEKGVSDTERQVQVLKQVMIEYLRKRGESAGYLHLFCTAAVALVENDLFHPLGEDEQPALIYSQIQDLIQSVIAQRAIVTRLSGARSSLETGQWWLSSETDVAGIDAPLADRVEVEVVRYLYQHDESSLIDIDRAICNAFPGLMTPDRLLMEECVKSYGETTGLSPEKWRLRPQDSPKARREDIAAMVRLIIDLGQRLGFQAQLASRESGFPGNRIEWITSGGTNYTFYITASAVLGKLLFSRGPLIASLHQTSTGQSLQQIIVVPGSRAGLVLYKVKADARLRIALESGWKLIKYRHMRRLSGNESLTVQSLDQQLDLDPLLNEDPQMQLL
jgi:hypothetical protein